jgi:hypothetical protein
MKSIYSMFTSILSILVITIFLSGCGKKDPSEGTGSSDSKKEETKEKSNTEKAEEENDNAGEVMKESTSSGSTSTDKMIDEYQEIVDEYVKIVKEMQSGNLSNVKDMQALATKTQEWSMRLTEIAPTLTVAQQERLEKISKEAEMYLKK